MPKPVFASLVLFLALVACGGKKAVGGSSSPTDQTLGGQTTGIGGFANGGGESSGGSLGTERSTSSALTGGNYSLGGASVTSAVTSANGGTALHVGTTGGAASLGGASRTGGTRNAGGHSTGGTSGLSVGGSLSNPGTKMGGSAATGGSVPVGGTIEAGGTKAAGGTMAIGGTAAMGGSGASGGVVTGGAKATGGSLANGGAWPVWPKKFCGNITTMSAVDPPGLTFAKHWDQITPENEGKWASIQPSTGSAFNWSRLDALYAYADQNGILFKEHALVWGNAQPSGYSAAAVEAWIKAFCERYPKVALIDVVNEPTPHTTPPYATLLGQGEAGNYPWITKSFKLTRQYCGNNPVLILNDYNNVEYADQETHFIEIVSDIKSNGAPIDAVGVQAHDTARLTVNQLQANLDRLSSETSLPVYITEFDVDKSDDADQLAIYQAQFPIFWNTRAIRGVTLWGWISGKTWRTNTGIVNGTAPRPAMVWLMDYLGRPVPPP